LSVGDKRDAAIAYGANALLSSSIALSSIAFRVKNKKVADSFKTYFNFMWDLAKP